MPEQSRGKNPRRPKPTPPAAPETAVTEGGPSAERQAPAIQPDPAPRPPVQRPAVNASTSTLRDQPAVAYALAFALLALLLICALSIYLAAN